MPTKFNEIVGNVDRVKRLEYIASTSFTSDTIKVMNLLLSGPTGCGKTTVVKCFLSTLYSFVQNEYQLKSYVLSLNASANCRTNDDIERIKKFCREAMPPWNCSENRNPKIKIVVLEECCNIPKTLFRLLYDIINTYNQSVRFLLTCNDIHKIPEYFTTICTQLDFRKLEPEEIVIRLREIVQRESMECDEQMMADIAMMANGDARTAVNQLQSIAALRSLSLDHLSSTISLTDIISHTPLPNDVAEMMELVHVKNMNPMNHMNNMTRHESVCLHESIVKLKRMIQRGYEPSTILHAIKQWAEKTWRDGDDSASMLVFLEHVLYPTIQTMEKGGHPTLYLSALLARMYEQFCR